MPLPHGFAERLVTMSDAEVLAMLAAPGDYVPEAQPLAQADAARRGLTTAQVAEAEADHADQNAERAGRAIEPLSPGMRPFCFLVPAVFLWMIFVGVAYRGAGYTRKGREVFVWMLCGFVFYGLIGAMILIATRS